MLPVTPMFARFNSATLWWRELQVTPIQLHTEALMVQFFTVNCLGSIVIVFFKERRADWSAFKPAIVLPSDRGIWFCLLEVTLGSLVLLLLQSHSRLHMNYEVKVDSAFIEVIVEDESIIGSMTNRIGGDISNSMEKKDLKHGIIGKDGQLHNVYYSGIEDSLKKGNGQKVMLDPFFYPGQEEKIATGDATFDNEGTEASSLRNSSVVLQR
ncbi:unnamed protein product [Fraxinus pennsylvanica]|uniref:Uncharacterized protein n=1 Tax=Fraxinus pennsylvanica TaxID=56036 RepID=A0AAD2EBR1_9LAMI|nr:unnamed protein product [Fraxinus pennsylvanica]